MSVFANVSARRSTKAAAVKQAVANMSAKAVQKATVVTFSPAIKVAGHVVAIRKANAAGFTYAMQLKAKAIVARHRVAKVGSSAKAKAVAVRKAYRHWSQETVTGVFVHNFTVGFCLSFGLSLLATMVAKSFNV